MSSELDRESGLNDAKTTGVVHVHTNIGEQEGVIVELRRKDHDAPWEDDFSHLSDEKARELYDQLGDYLGEAEFNEDEIRENVTIDEVSQQNGPVPREQIAARYGEYETRGDTKEEALDKLVSHVRRMEA